jgi:site-specific DNA-methyltransferase (adenine-specific)
MKTDKLDLSCEDCMALMARFPDKHFDLAIVDPPYGLGFGTFNRTNRSSTGERVKANKYKNGDWDKATPPPEYFEELRRVSKHQIIWGGNYFALPAPFQCFIFWYKQNPVDNFADGELAWTSFERPALCFPFRYYGGLSGGTTAPGKIHPTQKPVELYQWTLENFAVPGQRILDTHLGSGSHAIAAHYFGAHLTACEIDKDYFDAAVDRIKRETAQLAFC